MNDSISVIIPVLDEASRIAGQIEPLVASDFHEVLVVDGGSRDGTQDVVRAIAGATLIESPRGRGLQMNRGAARATGDILLFLHADVSLPETATTRIRRTLRTPGVAAGAFRTWTVPDEDLRPWWSALLHLADLRSRYTSLPYGDQALFVGRAAFAAAGGYPEIPLMEDLELSRRLRRLGEIRTVRENVRVSGRRFLHRPIYFAVLMNVFPLLHRLGVAPATLQRLYGNVR